jgi:hypothetical protein
MTIFPTVVDERQLFIELRFLRESDVSHYHIEAYEINHFEYGIQHPYSEVMKKQLYFLL